MCEQVLSTDISKSQSLVSFIRLIAWGVKLGIHDLSFSGRPISHLVLSGLKSKLTNDSKFYAHVFLN